MYKKVNLVIGSIREELATFFYLAFEEHPPVGGIYMGLKCICRRITFIAPCSSAFKLSRSNVKFCDMIS
jgi:hypothetical protein